MDGDAGWVLIAEQSRDEQRALRRLERWGIERVIAVSGGGNCAELTDPPTEVLRKRIGRLLGHPVEERLNCDVAHYPAGRGAVVWLLDQPGDELDAVLDAGRLVYRDLVRPFDPEQPTRLCVPVLSLADPADLGRSLREGGFTVLGTYEVGGCRRP